MELDRADIALLNAVQKNNKLTSEELAERAHLSPTACQRRLKRLELIVQRCPSGHRERSRHNVNLSSREEFLRLRT